MLFSGISNTTRFLVLLVVIFANIILLPFLDLLFETYIFFDILNTVILITTVFALNQNKRYIYISAILATPLLLAIWLGRVYGASWPLLPGLFCGVIFFIFTAYHILRVVLTRDETSMEVIAGAVAVYLLLGFICAFLYGLIDLLIPGSFIHSATGEPTSTYSFMYFSFVTLTTLGYGDIVPANPIIQSLAIVEALVGQIYLVVLVAMLVGMHISEYRSKRFRDDKR